MKHIMAWLPANAINGDRKRLTVLAVRTQSPVKAVAS
jgi:hypothetical protein